MYKTLFILFFLCFQFVTRVNNTSNYIEVLDQYNDKIYSSQLKSYNLNSLNEFMSFTGYFRNLSKYQPNNLFGTCTFVSLAQILSYMDTFYNDDIIPERYKMR